MNQTCCFQRTDDDQDYFRFLTSLGLPLFAVGHFWKSKYVFKQEKKVSTSKKLLQKFRILSVLILLFHSFSLYSQNINFNKNDYRFEIPKISSSIEADGFLNEEAWNDAGVDSISWLHYPIDNGKAYAQTTIKMMYDEKNLYIGLVSRGTLNAPVVQSLKRDDENNTSNSDGITIVIDPANTTKNGYYFRVNGCGVLAEGTVYQNGMYPSGNAYWNNKWTASVSRGGDSISYEITLPFNAVKYNDENNTWGINFLRNDVARNETYSWTHFPANKNDLDLGFTGNLVFKEGLSKNWSGKIILMPSVTAGLVSDEESDEKPQYNVKAGLDAKVSVSSSLNLDLSVYPDFSNTEVDQQYIDFYRYEYYNPEQRTFFLENNDLFTNFGTYDDMTTSSSENRVKPVYTRRIGLKDGGNVPIIFGARLSGEVGKNTRVGLLNIQTEGTEEQEPQNYFIGSFQKGVFKRSSVKGLFTNRNSTEGLGLQKNDFNRTAGLEFDFSTEDGRWAASAKIHSSFTNDLYADNLFYSGGFTFFNKKFKTQNWIEHVDKNYLTDIGFVPRLYYKNPLTDSTFRRGYTHFINKYELYQFLNNDLITVMGEFTNIHTYLDDNYKLNEFSFDLGYWAVFTNRTHIVALVTYNRFDLLVPHDVLQNGNPVQEGTYQNKKTFFLYESDQRRKFKYKASVDYGGFYKGEKLTFIAEPTYTFQPFGSISLSYNFTNINLKNGLGKATYHLIGLKPEISFSSKLLWTNLLQYNTQLNDINFNSIFKWRFAPMSDFYFVLKYDQPRTDSTNKLELSVKLTYWLGI